MARLQDANIALDDAWELWPDFAIRSAGFPVSGLEAFGPDEDLAAVARDPAFREAVAWQSRASLANAVDKLAAGGGSPSNRRRWADVVASYWQRYCAKNDTIGFFGPLAWGSFGDRTKIRSGGLVRERVVHFETWAIEALAGRPLPMGPFPERALSTDTPGLARLLAARERITGAAGLEELDLEFEAVTGRTAVRGEDDSGGGRTIAYLDCMRDLDVTLGSDVLAELRASLPPVLEASRWWCGVVFARGRELLAEVAVDGPLAPQLGRLMGAGFGLHAQLGDEQHELQRRFASGDFADWLPAWPGSTFHSADLQLTDDGRIVIGDFHGGGNPLLQGLFGLRHPDPEGLLHRAARVTGPGVHLSPPRRGVVPMTARAWPLYPPGDTVVVGGDEPAPPDTRRVALEDVIVEDGQATDGTFAVPLADLLFLPIFVSALRTFEPVGTFGDRVQRGRLVLRRTTWEAPPGVDFAAWARANDLPRRLFVRSPRERKPRYVDLESPSLLRGVERFLHEVDVPVAVSEMLPGPDECFLGDYTSEFRIVAVAAE